MKYQVKHLKEVLEGIPDDSELFVDGFPLHSVDAAWMDSVAYLHIKREISDHVEDIRKYGGN